MAIFAYSLCAVALAFVVISMLRLRVASNVNDALTRANSSSDRLTNWLLENQNADPKTSREALDIVRECVDAQQNLRELHPEFVNAGHLRLLRSILDGYTIRI